jgi:hypothetical protein
MSAPSTLLEKDRRSLHGHRIRGLPAFWIGFVAVILSLLGLMARQREIPEIRTFARHVFGGKDLLPGLLHFQMSAPFATWATWLAVALLLWGWIELLGASRVKGELAAAAELKRQQQLARELESEQTPSSASPPKSG